MCGILGFASNTRRIPESTFAYGLRKIEHRGPDGFGDWECNSGQVRLGHRRLAILDLTPGGAQPMLSPCGDYALTFNGEIYNHLELRASLESKGFKFSTRSDTEVLLKSYVFWGPQFVSKLRGMFAFAIYDRKRKIIVAARDRAGEKPLFYSLTSSEFAFASEPKALRAILPTLSKIDHEALDLLLAFGQIPGSKCLLKGASKLAPGTMLQYDIERHSVKEERYWELPEPSIASSSMRITDEYAIEHLHSLLDASIKEQLVADVPVGILLSGGLDSSIIATIAAEHSHRIKTYCVTFPSNQMFNEAEHARLVSMHCGSEHIEIPMPRLTIDCLKDCLDTIDEPIGDSSLIPTLVVFKEIKKLCKVAIGGDGADELFGGYPHHSRLLRLSRLQNSALSSLVRPVFSFLTSCLPPGRCHRNWLSGLANSGPKTIPFIGDYFDWRIRGPLLKSDNILPNDFAESVWRNGQPRNGISRHSILSHDFLNYLPNDILVKVDRMSMAASIELRAPYLDNRIIEYAFREIPPNLRFSQHERKILLRKLAKKILPRSFDSNRKQGFSLPLNDWLSSIDMRNFVIEFLTRDDAIFSPNAVSKLVISQGNGARNAERIFLLLAIQAWARNLALTL
jgi:asparagine synthase (glutamine-hydrolysing)